MTTQAPHAIRTVFSLVTAASAVGQIPEHKIRIISPDIGGGFGGKVPVYPGYVIATVATVLDRQAGEVDRRPLGELASRQLCPRLSYGCRTGRQKRWHYARRCASRPLADHGAADAAANPSKFPAGLFNVCTGSYEMEAAHVEVDGVYTNKPPGGVAYRCSFRVTEAVHAVERIVDRMAYKLKMDPADLRLQNFIPPEKLPVQVGHWLGVRQRQLCRGAQSGDEEHRLR